ncbi:MAG: PAS domain S-box protein, partial [Candidatus Aegiribacteria sp.]|nr:PAS domain S-box protein [Candidatus Aegiribacteria sp.]
TMVHKTNAHRGVIWVKNGENIFQPVASAGIKIGDVLAQSELMNHRDILNQIQKEQQFVIRYKDDKDFLHYCPVLTEKEEAVLIVPVTNVAILHLVYASREIADESLANLLTSLSTKLSVAIEACTDHKCIVNEVQVRIKAEEELKKKAKQLIASEKKLQGLYEESEQARKSLLSILEDVTQKEDALRESEEKFRNLAEESPNMIFINQRGIVVYANKKCKELVEYKKEEFYSRDFDFLCLIAPESKDLIKERLSRHSTGEEVVPYECALISKTGKRIDVILTSKLISYEGENAILGIVTDITERKQAEEEQNKLRVQLTQAHKMESVGRLAGGVAHDFNNMLSVILGHTEMALEQIDPAQPLHAHLTEIRKAAERSADLTRQLLAFARKQTITPIVLNLNDTLTGMLKMLQRLIGEDIDLAWLPGTDVWPVKLDPSQIDQILANLCVNARDAIKDVGKITIETENVTLDEIYCADYPELSPGEYVLLTVSDTGRGMDRETLGSLFEPFFTTKETGKGTGLGLATVYGIVKQNNGFIGVYSEPDQGTTFKIYLPRHASKATQIQKTGSAESVKQGYETILLVEDEPTILQLTTMMLERQGYTVMAASTPGEAIRLAEEHPAYIHLLMTDVVMPEMNGRDLARNLLSIYPNLRRLFMSGYTANVIAHHGVLDEGVHFIQKPFGMQDMIAKVRETLDSE